MILIIAEKPSLGRNIAAGIGKLRDCRGYLEGEGYIVTWAFGHLFSLCDIEDYTGPTSSGRWSMENIPCYPEQFRFSLKKGNGGQTDAGVRRQFDLIRTLCNRDDVDTIVNAGDADREGEIIIRLCVAHALNGTKPLKRLWLPDQTPETVAQALNEMKNESEYDNLANEGFARTYIDWLYGVNLTRFATLKNGTLMRVGRVIAPIVKAIYDRDMAIRNFVPGKYYAVVSNAETNGEKVELQSKKRFEENEYRKAVEYAGLLNSQKTVVSDVKSRKSVLRPGKLFSLTKLQNVLGKKYKMPMDESLKILQGLYEKGYVTYPRTNSEYLATAEKDKIRNIVSNIGKMGYPVEFADRKTLFDDSKIESHSALTPTTRIPKKDSLSEKEFKVYQTVFRRFVANFCKEPCETMKTEITVRSGDIEEFVLKGSVIVSPGWTKYDDASHSDRILPPLKKGDVVNTAFVPAEKETAPPKHYTIETLNNYLKNPFRDEKAKAQEAADDGDTDDMEEYRAVFEGLELGTEATRTGIIDNAKKSGYISLKKDVYTILPAGEFYVEALERTGISMDKYKTSTLGQALKKVYHGTMTVDESVDLAKAEITEVFNAESDAQAKGSGTGFFGDEIGVCPVCGRNVVRGRYSYGCEGYREGCKFRIPLVLLSRQITRNEADMLLREGRTGKLDGFISKKTGKAFSAVLVMKDNKVEFDFTQ